MSVPTLTTQRHSCCWYKESRQGLIHFEYPSRLNISRISIYIFTEEGNQRLEVYARTHNKDTFFKIIETAQQHFSDCHQYHFDSCYDHFQKDQNGICSVEIAKATCSQLTNDVFEMTFLNQSLGFLRTYKTSEELSQHIRDALNVLQKADETLGELTLDLSPSK